MSEQFIFSKEFDVRSAGNALLNDYKRLQFENDKLTARIAELEAEVTKCHELQDSYCDRIAELEAENTALKQHPQPIEFWSDEKKELYRRNESRTIKSGREEECEE